MPTVIQISSFQIPDCNFTGSTFKLRRYYDGDWQDVDGVLHLQGTVGSSTDFFDEIDCTLTDHTGTVPSFSATPTLTALINPNVREAWQLWDEAGTARNVIADGWFIPPSPSAITRGALEIENQGQALNWPPPIYLNALQVQQLIDAQIGFLNHASSVIEGRTFLDVDPTVAIVPRAIGVNSPTIPAFVLHTSKYASLNAAIAAITSLGGGTVVIDSSTPVTSSVATTASIALKFEGQGVLTGSSKTVTIVGPLEAPVKQIWQSGITVSFAGNKIVTNFYPEWWGAAGNNVTNDQPALQAATDAMDTGSGGTLHLANANYRIASTWTVGSASAFHYINILGVGPVQTIITYAGATNSIAVKLNTEKFPHLADFTVNNSVAKGSTEGIRATGISGGTSTNGLVVSSVFISGFHYGWRTSDGAGHTSSEITFINLVLANNDTGFLNDDFNGLNFNFINLMMAGNTIGIDAETAGVYVHGGSASGNDTDFKFVNDGTNTIIGFRSETIGTNFINFQTASGSNKLSVIGCSAVMASSPNTATAILSNGGTVSIQDSNIGGQILVGTGSSIFRLLNSGIIDPGNTFTSTANPSGMGPGFRFNARVAFQSFGNKQYDGDFNTPVAAWPNCAGVSAADELGTIRAIVTEGNCRGSDFASNTNVFVRGRFFHVTGNNTITNIPTTDLPIGMIIRMVFDGTATLTDGGNLKLAGNLVATANDSATLINDDGISWVELSRSSN